MKRLIFASIIISLFLFPHGARAQASPPNIIYFLADNLGIGELSVFSGGALRGVTTKHIDAFAEEGLRLTNFAPEAQCTPSRSALMTGRFAIRSGNQKGPNPAPGVESGLVKWERTMGDVFSDAGYKTLIVGKWHIGESDGRWPTDHGFDEWYGISASYGESTWPSDPYYQGKVKVIQEGEHPVGDEVDEKLRFCPPGQIVIEDPESRDPVAFVTHSVKDEMKDQQTTDYLCQLNEEIRRDIDRMYLDKAKSFIQASKDSGNPFFLYFNHSMMHMPNIPRLEYKGKTGHGDWADALYQLDNDFNELMSFVEDLELKENTIVVFSGDNGPEDYVRWRGSSGHWDGSYFTGMDGSLRTPAIIRYPGRVPVRVSNEIVHITDMFTTLIRWAGLEVPQDRVIDGIDQRNFFEGNDQNCSDRVGFTYWLGDTPYGVKWRNFKVVSVLQRTLSEPGLNLPTPNIINLDRDPKEHLPFDIPYLHTWVTEHAGAIAQTFSESVQCQPLIPANSALDFVPTLNPEDPECWKKFSPGPLGEPKTCAAY